MTSYFVDFKKNIIEETHRKNLVSFCKEINLDYRMARKWWVRQEQLAFLASYEHGQVRTPGLGRTPNYPEMEDEIVDWILDRRAQKCWLREDPTPQGFRSNWHRNSI